MELTPVLANKVCDIRIGLDHNKRPFIVVEYNRHDYVFNVADNGRIRERFPLEFTQYVRTKVEAVAATIVAMRAVGLCDFPNFGS